ncbi:MAG TPA: P-type conjugative transfer protein TrbL [Devosia sp.]|nr:P-type conjugative transfer protein TrbL [Devosia sp.]
MGDLNIVDQFMQTFIHYIDSGFGLLSGDVAGLSTLLIALDVTLAGLFWAMDGEAHVLFRLLKKVLYVGFFALLINNFQALSQVVFDSFSTLGIDATNAGLSAADLLRPGKIAGIGYQAAWPLLNKAGSLMGLTTFFSNVVTIITLLFAWVVVILSFFILAVQLFITIIEFKLTTLAGFTLVPFALWNKTSFLAERVLGNVIASGIKVMVLAVIIGIGATFFGQFTDALQGRDPSLADAMSLMLASISLFGLGIFGPGIASGLVAGAPQLGAGAAVGTVGGLAAGAMLAGGAAIGLTRAGGSGLAAVRAASAPPPSSGSPPSSATGPAAPGGAPDWARKMQRGQKLSGHARLAAQAIKEGDRPGHGANPKLDGGQG